MLGFGRALGVIHRGDDGFIGHVEGLGVFALEDRPPRGVGPGLEHGPESLAMKAMTKRLQCLSDCSGMMSEIVDYFNAASFAAKLQAARNP